jgi:hypothetical protein
MERSEDADNTDRDQIVSIARKLARQNLTEAGDQGGVVSHESARILRRIAAAIDQDATVAEGHKNRPRPGFRRQFKWLLALIAAAAVVFVGVAILLAHHGRPTTPAGWTGLVGQLREPFSPEPLTTVWIISSKETVTEAHANSEGWFVIPLAAGDYDITYDARTECLRFYGAGTIPESGFGPTPTPLLQAIAIHVSQGQAVTFDRTYTGCVQGL